MITLYHNNMSTCAQKVRYVLAEKELEWESVELNLRKGDQHAEHYLKLNPAGVVPTLVNGDAVIVESGVICEYLEDLFPTPRLRPDTADRIAGMRLWIKYIDEIIHAQAGVISTAIAFRFQHLANGEDAVRARIEAVPSEAKRARMRSLIFEGVESALFPGGVRAFAEMLRRMEAALERTAFLAAESRTIADAVCLPYVVRLEHLQLAWLWDDLPRVAGWYGRLRETPSFATAFRDWEDAGYLSLMEARGAEYRSRVEDALAG
ncbi:MAG: glutathione S-transferase family protein [Defluviicoccus sp.]|nr:glutathione S-transferase family protein [Defluviicoccus sp.]